jgi:ABC-2 type transport system ATP-binding protein
VVDDGRTVAVKVTDSGRSVVSVVRALDYDAIEPESVLVREPTLDDVFLRLTGHATDSPSTETEERERGAA